MKEPAQGSRIVPAVHGRREVTPDPPDELVLAEGLRKDHSAADLQDLAARYAYGLNEHDTRMRRAVWRALTRRFGHGVRIGRGALATACRQAGRSTGALAQRDSSHGSVLLRASLNAAGAARLPATRLFH